MQKTVLISPYSRKVNALGCAKDYPYWKTVVKELGRRGYATVQLGVTGERLLGCGSRIFDLPLNKMKGAIAGVDYFMSVDNFFPHFLVAKGIDLPGLVVWGPSDPEIYGYDRFVNLMKDKSKMRPDQYGYWHNVTYDNSGWPEPHDIIREFEEKIAAVAADKTTEAT